MNVPVREDCTPFILLLLKQNSTSLCPLSLILPQLYFPIATSQLLLYEPTAAAAAAAAPAASVQPAVEVLSH